MAENHNATYQLINKTRSELFNEALLDGEEDVYPSDFRMTDFSDFLMEVSSTKGNKNCTYKFLCTLFFSINLNKLFLSFNIHKRVKISSS